MIKSMGGFHLKCITCELQCAVPGFQSEIRALCVSKHIYVDFLHCIPNSLFEFIKFKHWCFKNLVFDVTPKKEIKWGYIRASCRPGDWTTPPKPSVLKCPVKGFSYPQSLMYRSAILLKYQMWYYSMFDKIRL